MVAVGGGRRQVAALQRRHHALVDADVLLLRLHHPHALAPHAVHHAEDVQVLRVRRQLHTGRALTTGMLCVWCVVCVVCVVCMVCVVCAVGAVAHLLQRAVQRDEGAGAADAGAAVHDDGPAVGRTALAERANEPAHTTFFCIY